MNIQTAIEEANFKLKKKKIKSSVPIFVLELSKIYFLSFLITFAIYISESKYGFLIKLSFKIFAP